MLNNKIDNKPLISVILPTFNGGTRGEGKYLREAIESVLNQTYENFELIIVNDGSIDNTEDLILSYNNKRIIYLQNANNMGLPSARNTGLGKAKGKYIAFLDDDDYFYSKKLEEQLLFLQKNNANVTYCFTDIVSESRKIIGCYNNNDSGDILNILLLRNFITPSSVMISKDVYENIGYFKIHLKRCADWDYWIRISTKYKFFCLEKILLAYRKHSKQMSLNLELMAFDGYVLLFENLLMLKKNSDESNFYLHHLFNKFYKRFFYHNDMINFRKYYKISSAYGSNPISWKARYILSFFPNLIKIIRSLKNKLKSKTL